MSREITKLYEETIRGRVSEVLDKIEKRGGVKGELTIVVEGALSDSGETDTEVIDTMLRSFKVNGLSIPFPQGIKEQAVCIIKHT